MGADANGGGVIRQHQNPVVLPCLLHGMADRGDNPAVQVLNGLHLFLHQTLVTHFVRSLQVDVGKVAAVLQKGVNGRLGLALPVGIQRTGGPGHLINLHSGSHRNALEQVNGGNHGALQAGFLGKAGKAGLGARAPVPEGIGLPLALRRPPQIHGMVVENLVAALHEAAQHRILRQEGADDLSQMVMGRLQFRQMPVLPDHDVPVAGAGVELEGIVIEVLPDGLHQSVRFLGGNFPGGMVKNPLFGIGLLFRQGHHIAAENDIVRLHLHTHAQSFQG